MFKEECMDSKEALMQAATALINEKGESAEEITVREICKRANVGLGLVNYHFGNKDRLIALCVERMINGIVDGFCSMQEEVCGLMPFEKLTHLGNMTLAFLFEHYAISRISILSDMEKPGEDDNTHRTYRAYLPLVSACRPDWDESTLERKTFCLIAAMQQLFLRHKVLLSVYGIDLTKAEEREAVHERILRDVLGG